MGKAPAKEAANREEAVQRMRDCLKIIKTELRPENIGLAIPTALLSEYTSLILR